MKNIDKSIEEFEENLITIGRITKQIEDLNKKLSTLLNETNDIEELKNNIIKEIDNINKIYEEKDKKINEQIELISDVLEEIKSSLGKDTEKIINPIIEKMEETTGKNTNDLNKLKTYYDKKINEHEKFICKDNAIIKIGLLMNFILTMLLLILK